MDGLPVYEILREAGRRWPEQPAIHDEWGSLSFGQLLEEAEKLKRCLMDLGVGQGKLIGLRARNGRYFLIGLFAIVGTGAAVLPIYHQLRKEEIDSVLLEAGLHGLLDDRSGGPYFQLGDELIRLESDSFQYNSIPSASLFPPFPLNDPPAFVRFTSGTTGKSKGVVISQVAAIERIEAANAGLGLGPGDTVIWVLPMAYHFVVSLVLYVRFGVAIAVSRDFLARHIIGLANRYSATLLYASPLQIRLLAADQGTERMPSLKKVISTSAGISSDICQAFSRRFAKDVSQAYGIIEIGLPLLNSRKSSDEPDAVGYPLPGYTIAILDEQHNPLPAGRVGQLGIRGPGMFDAYLLPFEKREKVLVNGYFLTADYASQDPDGLVRIAGRAKSVINVSGIKVFPEEIEAVLESIPEIKMARIQSVPHKLLGQVIEGEIVLHEGTSVDIEAVLTYCRKRLSNFKSPQRLRIVTELPLTGSGKLMRS
jgi:acyl-coenzyme A synthetase/AMP-(fatty) acid ligase